MNTLLSLPKLSSNSGGDSKPSSSSATSSAATSSDVTAFDDPRIYSKINKIQLRPPYVLSKLSQELPERALEHFVQTIPSRIGLRDIHAEMKVEPGLSSSLIIYESSPCTAHDVICAKFAEIMKRNAYFGNFMRQGVFVSNYGRAPDGCIVVPNSPCPPNLNTTMAFVPQPSVIWEIAFDEDESSLCAKLADAVINPKLGNIRSAIGIKIDHVDPESNGGFSVGPRLVAIHCRRTRNFTGIPESQHAVEDDDPDGPPPLLAMKAEFGDVIKWGDAMLELPYSDVFLGTTMPDGNPVPEGFAMIDLFEIRSAIQPFIDGQDLISLPPESIDDYENEC